MLTDLKRALAMLIVMTAVTGVAYPLLVTAIGAAVFPAKAKGSLLERDGKTIGSTLIGQSFSSPKHFWSRPSATSPYPYNASASSGSNQGPLNPALTQAVTDRIKALQDADPDNRALVPVDLVTASASGLDPHISPAGAEYQVNRVARARNMDPQTVRQFVAQFTQGRQLGFLGEARVNVLELNLALDALP